MIQGAVRTAGRVRGHATRSMRPRPGLAIPARPVFLRRGLSFFLLACPNPLQVDGDNFPGNHLLFRCRAWDRQGDERAARVYSVDGSQSMMKFVNKPCSFRG